MAIPGAALTRLRAVPTDDTEATVPVLRSANAVHAAGFTVVDARGAVVLSADLPAA